MKTRLTVLIIGLLLSSLSACTKEDPKPDPTPTNCKGDGYTYELSDLTYTLRWAEEFDGTSVNLSNWQYETGASGWGNNELQHYTPGENASVSDGHLTITIKKEAYKGSNFTSTRMVSRDRFEFRYGKVEVRAKMPELLGTWAAIWMMPANSSYGTWPKSGEIDIMEYVGYEPDRVHGTVHTDSYNHKKGTQQGFSTVINNVADEFHIYTIEWLPDQIRFYIDGQYYWRYNPGLFLNCPIYKQWPFDQDFYLILNTAVGGDWGGARGIADTGWPQEMQVDYIRVYAIDQLQAILDSKK